ncbi:glycosyltransferase [Aliivibrio fischeri]|uniref:glycosyltransferase n=1 Tax=Aliivibrio fischeri TaxID=668 RepID=UPI0012DAC12C|nr:glycosyltransferase [Aliivibrio fischeri]MUK39999.1 glycosyltransferase [Aliivibrio fischeri]
MRIAIHAVNINTGGALVLLNEMLEKFHSFGGMVDLYISSKVELKVYKVFNNTKVIKCRSLIRSLYLKREYDRVVFFGNLPPLNNVNNSYLYIHNAYLASDNKIHNASFGFKVKIFLLKKYIRFFIRNVDFVVCQTVSMKDNISKLYDANVYISPFYKFMPIDESIKEYDFCYIGLPSIHKNHSLLLKVLELLKNEGVNITIALTVPDSPCNFELINRINNLNKSSNIKIVNFGFVSIEDVVNIYLKSKALIFPSKIESYGLPLIEAAMLNLTIFAPDKNYVNDVIKDYYAINIEDANDIKVKLKRFVENNELYKMAKVITPNKFIGDIMKGTIDD